MLEQGDRVLGGRFGAAAPTLVRLVSSCAAAPEGEALALSAHVVTVHRDGPVPTGLVAFRAGHRLLGTAALDASGTAVLDGVQLPTGLHAVVGSYGGDVAHAAATSAPLPQAVVVRATPVAVVVAAPVRTPGGVVLEAEVLDAASGRLVEEAIGSLVFSVGRSVIGSAPLEGGQARLVLDGLAPEGAVSARYDGDGEHAAASGSYVGAVVEG